MPLSEDPPSFRFYDLHNDDSADTIFPILFDTNNVAIWKGSDHNVFIHPGSFQKIDLKTIHKGPPSHTVLFLGCGVQGTGDMLYDKEHPGEYVDGSNDTATGTYKDRKIKVKFDKRSGLNVAATAELQDAYAKLNNQSVAKFLVAVANLMSPEVI